MADTYKLCSVEEAAGCRADFRVHYTRMVRKARKPFFDAVWAPDEDAARVRFLASARELRWRGVIVTRVVAVPKA